MSNEVNTDSNNKSINCVFTRDIAGNYNAEPITNVVVFIFLLIIVFSAGMLIRILFRQMNDRVVFERNRFVDENLSNVF